MRPSPLPPALRDAPFGVADAQRLGVGPHRLRRSDLRAPTRGARCHDAPLSTADRARAVAAGLADGAAYSHVTAAVLWGIPLPADLEGRAVLDVVTRSDSGQVSRRGCRGHRGVESREVALVGGVPVVGLADTWCDLGDLGRRRLSVDDLVVAGDAAVARLDAADGVLRAESAGVARLRAALARRVRPRRAVALRQALGLVRAGVRSPQESRTRLLFGAAGLPEPEVNGLLTDRFGEFIGEGDLVWRRAGVVAEYQGAVHAPRARRSADSLRRELAVEEGWTVHEVWAEDLRPPRCRSLVLRVARSLGYEPSGLVLP
ncbi:hypothetical protein [uncultured Phycicoccus sp.]|uniref:hypothetical protein n=1 Tax=uncultured Phycicoccus sp. TaxID=661422 RepID=UPI00260B6D04|nr:hypothetical protein [uncultured Phycicoccus sp.]